MGSGGYNEEIFFVETARDLDEACHGVQWFNVSLYTVGLL